jgi:DNA mismatch repair protein MutS
VAQLAGVPRPVIHRAEELLHLLESGELRPGTPSLGPRQLQLFTPDHPVISELRELDVSQMTPLEAINKLYALKRQAKEH